MRPLLASLIAAALVAPACSQTPVVVPLRSMERPRDLDFICLEETSDGRWEGRPLETCALNPDDTPKSNARLFSLVTQMSRGELAVVDIGQKRDDSATLVKVDPRVPGYSFIPVGAAPTDVVADPLGQAVYVSSGRDPRIDILPAGILHGPIDTTAAVDPPPWPHITFDRATEGMPSAMSIIRTGEKDRVLYVTLPDAKPTAKIAVFDLATPTLPGRRGDIALGAPDAQPIPWAPIACGPKHNATTWWSVYDTCKGEKPRVPVGATSVDPKGLEFHLAGVAAIGGNLFVADDRAPVIHVYDATGGLEIRRITVGAPTSKLAVSPVVPDEVTFENSAAIDVCMARGWLGDGKDHSAESKTVAEQLKGRCRAHRYIYAIDLVDGESTSGSIIVIDVPVITAGGEKLDIDGSQLVQPMACDAPTFAPRRIPLGPFGLNGANVIPARSIAFVNLDPAINNINVKAARCRGWDVRNDTQFGHPRSLLDLDPADGVPPDERQKRIDAGVAWRAKVDPKWMRGVFAWVALANGAVVVVDVDDYDSTCRGPTSKQPRGKLFQHPDEIPDEVKNKGYKELVLSRADDNFPNGYNGEYYPYPVRRHHPRSLRVMNTDLAPVMTLSSLSRFDTVLSNDPVSPTGAVNPHLAGLVGQVATDNRPTSLLPAPDNPYAFSTEGWSVTFEGVLPGFSGTYGALIEDAGKIVFKDPSVGFCRKGVESDGDLGTHDVVQLIDDTCTFNRCTAAEKQACLDAFGESTALPLPRNRSLLIEKAFEGQLLIANKHFVRGAGPDDFTLADGPPDLNLLRTCFGDTQADGKRVLPLLRYVVRSSNSWVVVGGVSGFLHRKIADPGSADAACIEDPAKPRIMNGRAFEIEPLSARARTGTRPPYEDEANAVTDICRRFVNPTLQFAIRSGVGVEGGKDVTLRSKQDMRFTIGGRFAWQPLSIGAGSLSGGLKPIAAYVDGVERLNWRMMGVVDTIDRGLLVFPSDEPFTFQKGIN